MAHHVVRDQQPLAEVLPAQLRDEVLPGDEAGDIDAAAEKVIFDRIDVSLYCSILFARRTQKFFQKRRCRNAGRHGKRHAVRRVGQAQRRAELRLLQAQHADAVFQLREFLVEFLRRQRAPRLEIQLVGAEEDARAEFFNAFVAEGIDQIERLGRVLRRERRERVEPLTKLRQTDRHDRHAVHLRIERREVTHRALQLRAVIQAGAADDLAVHGDAAVGKAAHDLERLARARIAEQKRAQLRVRRVHGDIDGADVQVDDALHLALGQVRERHIIAHEEAQARVVVLEIQRRAHTRRHLVDEAEHAVVGARVGVVHEVGLKVQPQLAAEGLRHVHGVLRPVRAAQAHRQLRVIGVVFIVQHIGDRVAVDGHQPVAGMGRVAQRAVGVDVADRAAMHTPRLLCGNSFAICRKTPAYSKRRGANAPLLSFF